MRSFSAIVTIGFLVATAKAGQFLGHYNTFPTTQFVVPSTSFNHIAEPHARIIHPGISLAPQVEDISHRAVIENSIAESQLPQELLNPFYKNPSIASVLAKESWFANKEFPVHHREAEKIPREEIYKIISRLPH